MTVKTINTRMTVKEFIELYKTTQKPIKEYLEIKNYIPYTVKCAFADKIIENSSYNKDNMIQFDSCKRNALTKFTIINAYTNVQIDEKHFMEEYDSLEELGLIDRIIKEIPSEEYNKLMNIIEMKLEDFKANNYEIHSFVSKELNRLLPNIQENTTTLLSVIEGALSKIDEKKLGNAIMQFSKR